MIEKQKKRKRLFYVPGMISLVLIPLFCLYHFYKIDAFKVYSSISVSFPSKEGDIKKEGIEKIRKYKLFRFNSEKSKEKSQLKELRFFVRDLYKKYDTINGAKVHVGAKVDYDTYVEIINIALEETEANWVQFDNDMYILGRTKPKKTYSGKIHLITCGYEAVNKEYFLEQERKAQLERNIALLKKNWILFLGYFCLSIVNIFALVRLNRHRYL
ncbi:hypothetical protein [Flavobacterium hungaricum]|uniref:Uncharacterized protein n=1 Tax=Flavobacterium hungaricum TaxID=2082725 RepID=A0ABR9TRQ7_9FLAO|nr:hypothetical protein [Flavobacterium hungaricum]MBE8728020.1 hypothetical protein [Flavobacterium hungaricum]